MGVHCDPKQHDQAAAGARRERLYPRQHERRQVRQALRAQRVPGKDVGPGEVAALARIHAGVKVRARVRAMARVGTGSDSCSRLLLG